MRKLRDRVCVLVSGGFDSAALCGYLLKRYRRLYPLYVVCGLRWERTEQYWLQRFLRSVRRQYPNRVSPLTVARTNIDRLYGKHWSTNGCGVPGVRTRDAAVYLPGRNLLLLTHAAIFCERRGIHDVALGHLAINPFPDGRPQFFRAIERTVQLAMHHRLRIHTPFAKRSKRAVVQQVVDLPIHLTFSCLNPRGKRPCSRCNKCAERKKAVHVSLRNTPSSSRN